MFRFLILSIATAALSSIAIGAPASTDTIKEILEITECRKLIDGAFLQTEMAMRNSIATTIGDESVDPQMEMIVEAMIAKSMLVFKEEFSWEKLEPQYIDIYQKSFNQEEAAGLLAFYKSPSGEALIKKMPAVIQHTMTMVQELLASLHPKMQAITQETMSEILKAEESLEHSHLEKQPNV